MKKHWIVILQAAVLAVAAVCLLFSALHNDQAILSLPTTTRFSGVYSQNGEPWQPLDSNTDVSALGGDIVLLGHFDCELPEGGRVNFYLNHIGFSVYINGERYAINTVMELHEMGMKLTSIPSVCGRQWDYWLSPGITPEDEIEIHLHNPHGYGNETAYRDFLSTLCLTPDMSDVLDKKLEPYCLPFQAAGWGMIIAGVMLLGAAIASAVMGVSVAGTLCKYGLLAMFAGAFFLFDTVNFSFLKGQLVFNTYGRQLSLMLCCFWAGLCVLDGLSGKRLRGARIALSFSALLNLVLMLVSLSGVMLIYDTQFYWMAAQIVLCLVLLVCCGWEFRKTSKVNRGFLLSCCLMLLSILVDLVIGPGESICSQGNCTKFAFVILFVYNITRILTDVVIDHQASLRAQKLEAELEDSRISVMLSQIQPHFLYNALTSIYQLCEVDPPTAQKAVGYFSKYLRRNMASLSERKPIPFEEELRHVESYLNLEKLRYGDKLQVIYDVVSTDFAIPALTVQPLVENAVKHGIGKKKSGGVITIMTRETPEAHVITVTDTGVGFDPEKPKQDGQHHLGLKSVRDRLTTMSGGRLEVASVPGQGTTVTISIPKGGRT